MEFCIGKVVWLVVLWLCVQLMYLTEVVVDIKASAIQQQIINQSADNGQLPLHHSNMQSSVINNIRHDKWENVFADNNYISGGFLTSWHIDSLQPRNTEPNMMA